MATTMIAAYAAVVATCALGWEVFKWRRDRRLAVRVELRQAVYGYEGQHVVLVTAMNDGDHAVRAASWGLETNDGSGRDYVIFRPLPGSTLPGILEAHDAVTGISDFAELDASPELDFRRPVVAYVNLATGERVRSEPQTLVI